MTRTTESSNALTLDIDVAEPTGIVRLLRQSDAQLFAGFGTLPSLFDAAHTASCGALVDVLCRACSAEDTAVVVSGAGASGMLAFLLCRTANEMLGSSGAPSDRFRHLVAGGDAAIVRIEDSTEDDAPGAVSALEAVLGHGTEPRGRRARRAVYIGVSCGMSATYVGAQLEYAMDRMAAACAPRGAASTRAELVFDAVCLLGFNQPSDLAPVRIQRWGTTCADVVHRLARLARQEELTEQGVSRGNGGGAARDPAAPVAPPACGGAYGRRQHFIFHPTVGPEPISGSTRMKGGSATKILLEAVILTAVAEHFRGSAIEDAPEESERERVQRHATAVVAALRLYAAAAAAIYAAPAAEALADVVRSAGTSLCDRGSVVYAGASSAGILGLFDSAECPPTFGAHWQQVRGFVRGGWFALGDAARGRSEENWLATSKHHDLGEGAGTCKGASKVAKGKDVRVHDLSISLGALLSRGIHASDTVLLLVPSHGAAADAAKSATEPPKLSAYNLFVLERGAQLRPMDSGDRMKQIGGEWKKLSAREKQECQDRANEHNANQRAVAEEGIHAPPRANLDVDAGDDMWKSLETVAKAARRSGARCHVVAFLDASAEPHIAAGFGARLAKLERAAGSDARLCIALDQNALDLNVGDCAREFGVCAPPVLSEFALKLCLNAISTGAFIQKGHVLQNRMINLSISNVKLWQRSIAIVRHFSGAGKSTALECLVRSAYRVDAVPGELLLADDESHVAQAKPLPKVVPLALLLAAHCEAQRGLGQKRKRGGAAELLTVEHAMSELEATPIIRSLLLLRSRRQAVEVEEE